MRPALALVLLALLVTPSSAQTSGKAVRLADAQIKQGIIGKGGTFEWPMSPTMLAALR